MRLRLRLRLTCQDTTRLVLEGEDRALLLGERVLIRVHVGMCKGCTRFTQQVRLMRQAMDGWRQSTSTSTDPGGPP